MIVAQARNIRDGLRAVVVPSVSIVDCHAWDALVADSNFYNCHGWLAALEYALGPVELLTLHGPAGLLGGCALWDGECAPGLFCLPEHFVDVPGPWDQEFLWIGARRSTHNEIPCTLGHGRGRALRGLLDAAEQLAVRRGRAGVVIPYMPLEKALELASLREDARVILHSAEASLAVPPHGLMDAMRAASKHDRWRTRRELAVFAEHGDQVEWRALDDEIERVAADLIAQNRAKHGSMQGVAWMRHLLDGQRRSGVRESAAVAVARRDRRIVALTVFYRLGRTLHTRYFGSDYTVDDDDFRYFVLSYYAPLDYAATHDIDRIELSISSLQAKSLRGAEVNPLAAFVLLADESVSREAVDRHNARFIAEHERMFGHHLGPAWGRLSH